MNTIRDRIETIYAASAFAEANQPEEAVELLQNEHQQPVARATTAQKAQKRSRPTLQAK